MAQLHVNGSVLEFEAEGDTPLLWVLREQLGLTGTKYGCGIAQCGACTVHIDGEASRQVGLCLLCDTGPIPEERFQGNLAPDLSGAGGRSSAAQLRQRLVDASSMNPATIMPSYHKTDGPAKVGANYKGKTILAARQIEDVVAYLQTLRAQPGATP